MAYFTVWKTDRLPERAAIATALRIYGSMTYREIGIYIGISANRARQIVEKAIRWAHWYKLDI